MKRCGLKKEENEADEKKITSVVARKGEICVIFKKRYEMNNSYTYI